jgi:hypothetical protein
MWAATRTCPPCDRRSAPQWSRMARPSFGRVGCLPLGEQVFGSLGLALQPGQARLLVPVPDMVSIGEGERLGVVWCGWRVRPRLPDADSLHAFTSFAADRAEH